MCQKSGRKLNKDAPELHPVPVIAPWHHLGIDFIGPISPSSVQGNKYILTISDYFTKFVEAIPLKDKYATTVATALFNKVAIKVRNQKCFIKKIVLPGFYEIWIV